MEISLSYVLACNQVSWRREAHVKNIFGLLSGSLQRSRFKGFSKWKDSYMTRFSWKIYSILFDQRIFPTNEIGNHSNCSPLLVALLQEAPAAHRWVCSWRVLQRYILRYATRRALVAQSVDRHKMPYFTIMTPKYSVKRPPFLSESFLPWHTCKRSDKVSLQSLELSESLLPLLTAIAVSLLLIHCYSSVHNHISCNEKYCWVIN